MPRRHLIPILLFAAASVARAQTDSTPPEPSVCWLRPKPAPICHSILLTEAALEYPFMLAPGLRSHSQGEAARFMMSAGWLRNRADNTAIGGIAAFELGAIASHGPTRVEGRYRRWIGPRALDLGLGVVQGSRFTDNGMFGPTASLGFQTAYTGSTRAPSTGESVGLTRPLLT